MKFSIILGIGLLAMITVAPARADAPDIDFPALRDIEVPQPDKDSLANGLKIYLLEDHTLPRINVSVIINRCGSYLEPLDKVGLASMTGEVMRTGGTSSMTGDEIDVELEAIGASVETSIGTVSGSAYANMLSEYDDKVIGILADVLRNPIFDEDKIELSRTNERSAISRRNDDPLQLTIREFKKLIYGSESPYARHTEYATIDAVTQGDMVKFHKMAVQPNNIQMAVWGDFNKDEMVARIKGHFGDWPRGMVEIDPPPDVDYTYKPTVYYAEKTDVNQSNILVGHLGGKMGDKDYPATIVMNSVLGGSFGSRITDNIRTKRGWAYAAMGKYTFSYAHQGFFYIYTGTKSGNTVMAVREIKRIIKTMQTDPPTEEEMQKAKDGWLNSFVFKSDTKSEILNRVMTYEYYNLPPDYLDKIKSGVEKVTPKDVIEVAQRKLNPDNLQVLLVGNAEDFDEPPSALGEPNIIDLTIPGPAASDFAATEMELTLGMKLMAKAAEACGGVENCKKIGVIETDVSGTLKTPQGDLPFEGSSLDVLPDKSVSSMSMMMGSQTSVFDGESGWTIVGEQTQPMPPEMIEDLIKRNSRNRITLFANIEHPYYKAAGRGNVDFGGKDAVQLDLMTDVGAQFTLYLDATDHMPIGIKYTGQTPMGPGEIVETFSEYKEYGGVMMPEKTLREFSGMSMESQVVKRVVNGQYDASVFEKPGEI